MVRRQFLFSFVHVQVDIFDWSRRHVYLRGMDARSGWAVFCLAVIL